MIVLSDSQYYSDIANAIRAKNGENTQYKPSEMALAIKSLQGGGINCTLTISTVPNATVTAALGNTTVTAIADVNGTAILELLKEGVWTVTATYEGETVSTQVDTSLALETELTFADPILENNTWEQISKIARSGKASTIWNVGDTKTFTLNGTTFNAQIIGFDHNEVADSTTYGRAKSGITFQFKELPTTTYQIDASTTASANKWEDCDMRALLNGYITNNELNSDLIAVIVPVTISYEPTYSSVSNCVDKLFLLSENEFTGEGTYGAQDLGTQYAFWAAGNSRIKSKIGTSTAIKHWTRSRKSGSNTSYLYVNMDGRLSLGSTVTAKLGFAPAFCV